MPGREQPGTARSPVQGGGTTDIASQHRTNSSAHTATEPGRVLLQKTGASSRLTHRREGIDGDGGQHANQQRVLQHDANRRVVVRQWEEILGADGRLHLVRHRLRQEVEEERQADPLSATISLVS